MLQLMSAQDYGAEGNEKLFSLFDEPDAQPDNTATLPAAALLPKKKKDCKRKGQIEGATPTYGSAAILIRVI